MEANLPEIELCGTKFQFDIDRLVLIEKKDPNNLLFFNEMLDHLTHYEFFYSKINKNTPTERSLGPADDIFHESEKSLFIPFGLFTRFGYHSKFLPRRWYSNYR